MTDKVLLAGRLARRGEVDDAIELLRAELAMDNPPSRQLAIHGMLGDLYSMKFEVDSAVVEYDAIIKIMPQLEVAHFKKGLALKRRLTRESQEVAIAEFRESYRLGHAGSEALSNVGFCYKMLADFRLVAEVQRELCLKEAKENFLRSLELDSQNHHALFHLADLEFNAGQFEDARGKYRKLSEVRPEDPLPLVRMAHATHSSGDAQGALTPLQRALDLILARKQSPGWERDASFRETEVDCHLYRAEVLTALSRTQEARKEYEAVLDLTAPTREASVTVKMKSCRERALKMSRGDR